MPKCDFNKVALQLSLCEKLPKYGVFSGPYFPAFGLNKMRENTDQKKLVIWTLFTQRLLKSHFGTGGLL